jgi:hypothetical protein
VREDAKANVALALALAELFRLTPPTKQLGLFEEQAAEAAEQAEERAALTEEEARAAEEERRREQMERLQSWLQRQNEKEDAHTDAEEGDEDEDDEDEEEALRNLDEWNAKHPEGDWLPGETDADGEVVRPFADGREDPDHAFPGDAGQVDDDPDDEATITDHATGMPVDFVPPEEGGEDAPSDEDPPASGGRGRGKSKGK